MVYGNGFQASTLFSMFASLLEEISVRVHLACCFLLLACQIVSFTYSYTDRS